MGEILTRERFCPRCGVQVQLIRRTWAHEHPVLATIAFIFTVVWAVPLAAMYPIGAVTVAGIAAAAFGVRAWSRARDRRRALAARADYDHAQELAGPKWMTHPSSMGQVGAEQWDTKVVPSAWRTQ